ncbi:MAG TPA: hypothetical protein VKB52_14630 [Rhodanobacteraceae bacterium]|nr:hypothetical protein [Rhodanobacteraceae bacterium]
MKTLLVSIATTLALLVTSAYAAAPANAPAGTTGLCKDGTWYSGATKKGACHGHKGVKAWYGDEAAAAAPAASTKSTASTPTPTTTPAPATMPPQTFPKSTPTTMPNAQTPTTGTQTGSRGTLPGGTSPVAGGGAGKVWVNATSKVYHCPNDRYYGKTKSGEYMSEPDAVAKGNRPAHGKACSS